ncbi:helix-turn-helix domain-containing protein [Lacimonas salitolerans]|uniref:Helix-turn-helix domain-containing protein n=1 Tax=Lacimonas salitolerans TaxID=1323750 RepID=A0ABW4EJ81_9RHOB
MTVSEQPLSPAELRAVFGSNLRILSREYASISSLCAELGINRTQFNRYLAGESFPRPDILDRICRFFGVDARILLTPLCDLVSTEQSVLSHPYLNDWLGPDATHVPEQMFPSGFYRFSRRGFLDDRKFLQGIVLIRRIDGHAVLSGLEPREAMRHQGLPLSRAQREFRGVVLRQDEGVSILIARRGAKTGSYNFLAPVASYENNFWEGYVTRTVRSQPAGRRMTRMVYEHLGNDTAAILRAARCAGYCEADDLLTHHLRLLQIDQPLI